MENYMTLEAAETLTGKGAAGVLLKIVEVRKAFRGQQVLDGVNLEIPEGKITFIIGPSGTGKSVLLKHITGLLKPDSGHIYLDDVDIPTLSGYSMNETRKQMGVLFQSAALFDSFNVFENVAFPLIEHSKLTKEEIAARVKEKLELVGLFNVEKKMPNELSGGMRKRVGLARAIALNPRMIFYDEPTTGLDPLMVGQVNELIVNTNRAQNATSLVISHDIRAMMETADFAAIIHQGKIVCSGAPEEVASHPDEFVQRFVAAGLKA